MIVKLGGFGYSCNTYLILDKYHILIDPGMYANIIDEIEKYTSKIDFVINTHCHYDHVGVDHLIEEIYNCPIYIDDKEVRHLKNADHVVLAELFNSKLIPPKEVLPISELEDVEIIRTPGHTYGSITILYRDGLITGDTLFAYGVGRTDFPTGDIIKLRESIAMLEKIANQRDIKHIYPGHGEIGDRRAFQYAKLFL
ncbi:beta-lactamase domain-containing protein [Methanocaldococcus villosus KIN24-T80]|uniref:Beta-lactamase domain-containing protein n=1 Tax=Methanocaldococcus villosus KIN24-T80 TaxID=1069083 RepID=N6V3F2_9EURY|nr:MBL fold metallo-hydrolase [Methanocaldococcus villosus]ENN96793.1 beta-lactamase domain-containing protein [Methanocaldococcus villosus KIN24-T80]